MERAVAHAKNLLKDQPFTTNVRGFKIVVKCVQQWKHKQVRWLTPLDRDYR